MKLLKVSNSMTRLEEKAAEYSFNIPSKVYQSCKTQEEMKLWKDEIECAYIQGYGQASKDIEKQVEESVIEKSSGEVTIEDLVAYNQGFKIGRELTMQDFMEKAEEFFIEKHTGMFTQFKKYMQDEN